MTNGVEWELPRGESFNTPYRRFRESIDYDIVRDMYERQAVTNIGPDDVDDRSQRYHKTSLDLPLSLFRISNMLAADLGFKYWGRYARFAIMQANALSARVVEDEEKLRAVEEIEKREELEKVLNYREQNKTFLSRCEGIIRNKKDYSPEIVMATEDNVYNLADRAMDSSIRDQAKEIVERYLR